MLMYKQDYSPMSEKLYDEKIKQKAIANINRKIKRLGISHDELRLHKSLIKHDLIKC